MGAAGYVLAGGGSTRLGRDKALLELEGKPLLVRACDLLASLVPRVTVIAPPLRYAKLGVPLIADEWPGSGPLGGIVTALRHSGLDAPDCTWNVVLACDLPFVTRDWLAFLMARAQDSGADVVVAQSARGIEPLCAAYHTRCASRLAASLDRGVRRISDALEGIPIEYVREEEWKQFDCNRQLFKNINTPQDYEELQAAWRAKSS